MSYSRDFLTSANASFDIAPIQQGVPVLDQDLNLFQTAQSEARRAMIKDQVMSGFLKWAPVSTTATEGNILVTHTNSQVMLYGNTAVVDGMRLPISSGNIAVTLSAIPAANFVPTGGVVSQTGSRCDFLFLEVWRKEVTAPVSTSTADRRLAGLHDDGKYFTNGCTSADSNGATFTTTNDMIDPAVGATTCTRVQVQYRLRAFDDILPETYPDGLNCPRIFAWPSHKRNSADGVAETAYNFAASTADKGLYVAGDGSTNAKTALGTTDGYAYAIPVCFVNRRNAGAFALANMNGSSSRPDGKTDNIHTDDIWDVRHKVSFTGLNLKQEYENAMAQLSFGYLDTTFEQYQMNSDGDPTWNPTGIRGTLILRAEGVAGRAAPVNGAFQQTYQITHQNKANNGISTNLDGSRSYFSDIGGDQSIAGIIPASHVDGVGNSPSFFNSYVGSTKTLTLAATNLASGGGVDANRTLVSACKPSMKWGGGNGHEVAGAWTGLGTDTATFVMSQTTTIGLYFDGVTPTISQNAIFTSPNGVTVTFTGKSSSSAMSIYSGTFTGTTVPVANGAWVYVSGGGSNFTASALSYNDVGSGFNTWGLNASNEYVGDGYNLHAGESILIQAYATFTSGSSFASRVPYGGNSRVRSTQFLTNVGGTLTQQLPNSGTGYVPFGISADPHKDGNALCDSHTKSYGFTGFAKQTADIFNGQQGTFDISGIGTPSVMKDGSTLKAWYHAGDGTHYNILYTSSTDNGISWSTPVKVISRGQILPNDNEVLIPSVVKDTAAGVYKMWYIGYTVSGNNGQLLYSTSADGITAWSTPVKVIEFSTFAQPYNSAGFVSCSVIRESASSYKGWFGICGSNGYVILYADSTDGIAWTSRGVVAQPSSDGYNDWRIGNPSVIKDGTIYKMFSWGSDGVYYNINYSFSTDCYNWSKPQPLLTGINFGFDPSGYSNGSGPIGMSVIKDGPCYRFWAYNTNQGKVIAGYLSCTDTANSGSTGSLTGVYSTTGPINIAPPADSQVIMMYEAKPVPIDTSITSGAVVNNAYFDRSLIFTSYGTGAYRGGSVLAWRDIRSLLLPTYNGTYGSYNGKNDDMMQYFSGGSDTADGYTSSGSCSLRLNSCNDSYVAYNYGFDGIVLTAGQLNGREAYNGNYTLHNYAAYSNQAITSSWFSYDWSSIVIAGSLFTVNNEVKLFLNTSGGSVANGYAKYIRMPGRPLIK